MSTSTPTSGTSAWSVWQRLRRAGGYALVVVLSMCLWYACLLTVAGSMVRSTVSGVGGRVVVSVVPTGNATLDPGDAAALARALPESEVSRAVVPSRAAFTDTSPSVPVQSVDARFFAVYDWTTADGSPFTPADDLRASPVAVLGSQAAHALFADAASPVGRTVRIQDVTFTVMGVLAPSDDPLLATYDNSVLVPLQTGRVRLVGIQAPLEILIDASEPANAEQVADTASQVLTARYRAEVPFAVNTQASSTIPPTFAQLVARAADRVRTDFLRGKGFA